MSSTDCRRVVSSQIPHSCGERVRSTGWWIESPRDHVNPRWPERSDQGGTNPDKESHGSKTALLHSADLWGCLFLPHVVSIYLHKFGFISLLCLMCEMRILQFHGNFSLPKDKLCYSYPFPSSVSSPPPRKWYFERSRIQPIFIK